MPSYVALAPVLRRFCFRNDPTQKWVEDSEARIAAFPCNNAFFTRIWETHGQHIRFVSGWDLPIVNGHDWSWTATAAQNYGDQGRTWPFIPIS